MPIACSEALKLSVFQVLPSFPRGPLAATAAYGRKHPRDTQTRTRKQFGNIHITAKFYAKVMSLKLVTMVLHKSGVFGRLLDGFVRFC